MSDQAPQPPVAVPTRRILTIDDNDAIHNDFKKILEPAGAGTAKLAGAKAALFGRLLDNKPLAAPATPAAGRFEVDSALQGEEGFAKLQAAVAAGRPYSVAFVDMRMPPGWDGLQTIQRMWEVDPDVQVVICSAFSDYSWDEISAKLGLTDRLLILKKPFDPAEVSQLATALSEKWSLRRDAKLKMDELERMVAERTVALTHLALHDKLTGLGNRAAFSERVARAVARSAADADYRYAVLFLDFDRFKAINDSLGHDAGDRLLQQIAKRLGGALDLAGASVGDALAARMGGDEFTVLIEGARGAFDPHAFAQALLRILNSPYPLDDSGREATCTASIGLAIAEPGQYEKADDVMRDADTAMYHAKAQGKARYVVFDRPMHDLVASRMAMETDLRHALDRDELRVHYQPIVRLDTGALAGFEALVRWEHPARGLVPPLDFVPCCEEIGLIVPFGAWVLGRACRQLAAWRAAEPAAAASLTMSVNLSARQLVGDELVDTVRGILAETGVPPTALTLEITETAMVGDAAAAVASLRAIRALGVGVSLDDFGTGYSSLSALHQFPLTGLKIDRSFVQHLVDRPDYQAIVRATVGLARDLDMRLTAEGIETAEQADLLRGMRCGMAQGYHFGRPVPADQAIGLITARAAAVVPAAPLALAA